MPRFLDAATDIEVAEGATVAGIDAQLISPAGHISGTVSNLDGDPLEGIEVSANAYDPGTGEWRYAGGMETGPDGSFDFGGLATDSYRVSFWDYSGTYLSEYYDDTRDEAQADLVAVTEGATTDIDVQLALAAHITGTVTSDGSTGIEGIQVRVYSHNGEWWEETGWGQTEADGVYDVGDLASGTYRVEFYDDNGDYVTQYYDNQATIDAGADVHVNAPDVTSGIDAVLALAGHITGTVTKADGGDALGGVNVTAYRSNGSGDWDYVRDTSTNATDGTYDLGGLPTGDYRIEFRDNSGDYVGEYYDDEATIDAGADVHVNAPDVTSGIDAVLAVGGHVTGTVTDASDVGLGGINVNAYRDNGSVTDWPWDQVSGTQTNPDGTYDLGGLPTGDYRIEFRDDNGGDYVGEYYDDEATIDAGADVHVNAPDATSGIDAVLAVGGHVTGTVTDASDVGLGGISVNALRNSGPGRPEWVNGTQTNPDGTYDLGGLPAGDGYYVEFRDDNGGDYITQYWDGEATLEAATPVSVTLGTPLSDIDAVLALAGHVTGTVTNASDVGLGGINVNAYASLVDYYSGNQVSGTQTNPDGTYDLGGLPAGDGYLVEFWDNNGDYLTQYYDNQATSEAATPVTVTLGTPLSGIDAVLALAGHVTGKVTDASTTGLGGIDVNAYRNNGSVIDWPWDQVSGTQTNSDGTYDLGGLPTGDYRIEFRDNSGDYVGEYYDNEATIEAGADVHVNAPDATPGIDAVLAVGGHVTGTVTNASTTGLGGIDVNAYRNNGSVTDWPWDQVSGTQTNPDGTYDLGGLPTGDYRIEFRDNSGDYVGEYYDDEATIEAGADVHVNAPDATPGIDAVLAVGGHVTGTVTNAGDVGLGGINVSAYRDNGSDPDWPWEWVSNTQTNLYGTYDLGGLPTGDYRIEFYDNSGNYVREYYDNQATIDAGADVHVNAPDATPGIDAVLAPAGHVTGKVTDASTTGLGGISVYAHRNNGSVADWPWEDVSGTQTNPDGTYDLGGLPTGDYRIEFYDNSGVYVGEYYDDEADHRGRRGRPRERARRHARHRRRARPRRPRHGYGHGREHHRSRRHRRLRLSQQRIRHRLALGLGQRHADQPRRHLRPRRPAHG